MVCGGEAFNNLYEDCRVEEQPQIDYVAHAGAMGAHAVKAKDIADLEAQIAAARGRDIPTVIVIDTNPAEGPGFGDAGHWWDVAVPEVSNKEKVNASYAAYLEGMARQRLVN